MFGQSLLSAFGIACTTDTDQLFTTDVQTTSVATYQLNNATTSIPSNTYPGTAYNANYAAGKFGNAYSNDGSAKYILLPRVLSTNFTWSFWVNFNSLSTCRFFGLEGGLFNPDLAFQLDGNGIRCYSGTPNGYIQLTSNPSINTWYHIVAVSGVGIYVNNTLYPASFLAQPSGNGPIGVGTDGVDIGEVGYLDGLIDQVRIFNTALPASAITALYNETTTTATYPYVDYVGANPNSIAYYKMSDATDQLGNYNSTATNVNFNTEGKFGFAGAFNGSSSSMSLPFNLHNTAFSISFWAINTLDSNNYYIIANNSGSTQAGWHIGGANGGGTKYNFRINNGTSNYLLLDSATVDDTNWHHVVVTWDNTTNANGAKIYINGSLSSQGTSTANTSFSFTNSTTQLMKEPGGTLRSDGKIDQVRIYDSALSAADVTTLYKEVECEPAAINALDHFNTVLYTGNGGTQAVTGVGFKPNFSWVKNRNTAGNPHELADVVRGVDNTLNSNTTNGEYNNATYQFNSFDTDGITVTDDAAGNYGVNGNNETYVAWNWKAPLANLSTSFNGSSSIITLPTALSDGTTTVANCISFWFNVGAEVTSSTTNNEIMTFAYSGGSSGKISLGSTTGNFSGETFSVTSDVTTQYTYSKTNIPAGWNNAVVQWNSGTTKWDIYINGVAHTTYTFGTNEQGNWALKFGQRSSFYFNGSLNQIRVFNSILSASEISDLYAEPLESNNTLNYPAGAGCIAAYPLQTDAVDLSGNYSGASSNVTFGQPGYLTGDTNGTIPSTVATNVDAGFSIVKYTGNNTAGSTVGHGLSSDPEMVIVKGLDNALNWIVYHTGIGATKYIQLNTTGAEELQSNYNMFNSTAPSSTVFSLGNLGNTNGNNLDYIAYCFTSIPGYSKIGSYIGTGGAFTVYTGFAPSFVMIKRSDSTANWVIIDNKRGGTSRARLYPNLSNAEDNNQGDTLTSNGFSPRTTPTADTNINGGTFIYLAIA